MTSSSNGADDLTMVQTAAWAGRITAIAGLRAAGWGLESSMRIGSRLIRAALNGESPALLMRELGPEMRRLAQRLLDIADQVDGGEPVEAEDITDVEEVDPGPAGEAASDGRRGDRGPSLKERATELLRRSAELHADDDDGHPAYERMLEELAPDEARILRLLATEGEQPSVDVRSAGALKRESELVAAGMNTIGPDAGCRRLGQVPAFLTNLERLGLIWFSREAVGDDGRYQVLEAQPEVMDAMRRAGRGRKVVQRSIRLTPLGVDFCKACLPLTKAQRDALEATPQFAHETGEEEDDRREMP